MTFEEIIKAYLDKRAAEDPLFAQSYSKEGKTLDKCLSYIKGEAKKQAEKLCAVIEDEVVYGWAVHYYDEDDIEVEEDKSEVTVATSEAISREKAEKMAAEELKALAGGNVPHKTKEAVKTAKKAEPRFEDRQLLLFDMTEGGEK